MDECIYFNKIEGKGGDDCCLYEYIVLLSILLYSLFALQCVMCSSSSICQDQSINQFYFYFELELWSWRTCRTTEQLVFFKVGS